MAPTPSPTLCLSDDVALGADCELFAAEHTAACAACTTEPVACDAPHTVHTIDCNCTDVQVLTSTDALDAAFDGNLDHSCFVVQDVYDDEWEPPATAAFAEKDFALCITLRNARLDKWTITRFAGTNYRDCVALEERSRVRGIVYDLGAQRVRVAGCSTVGAGGVRLGAGNDVLQLLQAEFTDDVLVDTGAGADCVLAKRVFAPTADVRTGG
eukprot:CAMPEP_0198346808 /NCGR_PEP_ID=MMETSP1450-20131203/81703_1 /TAXON_ID=753684 ORGANISM="Madagascaria erythrocladiodes, Strain CCMP3234" /NCGR_SAMPLE_ID=MMETSP1450 /ASSEMBLY_ACC=CAM_ASM_001115 /LENGTH=211 /DNA_ID=CAMNT_0044052275 /DNA_START=25 /DNA_END=656 /DNA_ORIENTATION=+